jgi:hypothetical protein
VQRPAIAPSAFGFPDRVGRRGPSRRASRRFTSTVRTKALFSLFSFALGDKKPVMFSFLLLHASCVHVSIHQGFVFNRVQRDKTQKRGYLQKSVVVLTERSDVLLWPLFRLMVEVVGREYFKVLWLVCSCGVCLCFVLCLTHARAVARPHQQCVPNIGAAKPELAGGATFLHAVYHEAMSWAPPCAGVLRVVACSLFVLRWNVVNPTGNSPAHIHSTLQTPRLNAHPHHKRQA